MKYQGSGVVQFEKRDVQRIKLGVDTARKSGLEIPHRRAVNAGLYALKHWLPGKQFSARKRRFEERGHVHPIVTRVNAALARGEKKLARKIEREWEEYQASFAPLLRRVSDRYGPRILAAVFLFAAVAEDEDSGDDSYSYSESG